MMMAAARLDIPAIMVSGGPMLTGYRDGKALDLNSVSRRSVSIQAGSSTMRA